MLLLPLVLLGLASAEALDGGEVHDIADVDAGEVSGPLVADFPYETIQLGSDDIGDFSAIAFGEDVALAARDNGDGCRAYPGSADWPSDAEWARLNSSLAGALLKPIPPAAACYPGPNRNLTQCNFLLNNASRTRFYSDDPLTVLTQWGQGNTCVASATPEGECTQGGFPIYVVNATTVKDIQVAVNFARNKNIRLTIKNSGHDFLGRNTGAYAIGVWTHYLKSFELIPYYRQGRYTGMAARVGAGLETWEVHNLMVEYNITLIVPLGNTVGPYGGFTAGGGHSTFASYYGLGSDQVLSIKVVTADGRFLTVDPDNHRDLFFALRGGGASTFGIVTSYIVKAHPAIDVTYANLNFASAGSSSTAIETFWTGVNQYFYFGTAIVDSGGIDRSYVSPGGNNTFTFRTTIELPGLSSAQTTSLLRPLLDTLNKTGISVTLQPLRTGPYGAPMTGTGARPGGSRFSSRLFPRANWNDRKLFEATMWAIRRSVEGGGYTFHGVFQAPTRDIAGYPGRDSGVNPAFRITIMHADIFDFAPTTGSPAAIKQAHERLDGYTDLIRAVTRTSGAYTNEADVEEPDWQKSFYGSNYPKLFGIKKERDPWGVFWAPATVGSEAWAVETEDGLPSQNGRLCRVR